MIPLGGKEVVGGGWINQEVYPPRGEKLETPPPRGWWAQPSARRLGAPFHRARLEERREAGPYNPSMVSHPLTQVEGGVSQVTEIDAACLLPKGCVA